MSESGLTAATTTTIRRPDAAIAAAPTGAAWPAVVRVGLIGAVVAIYLCLVGIVPIFEERPLINGSISLGQTALLLTALGTGYLAGVRVRGSRAATVAAGALAGLIAIGSLSILVMVGSSVDLRGIMLHASPQLFNMLTARAWDPGRVDPGRDGRAHRGTRGRHLAAAKLPPDGRLPRPRIAADPRAVRRPDPDAAAERAVVGARADRVRARGADADWCGLDPGGRHLVVRHQAPLPDRTAHRRADTGDPAGRDGHRSSSSRSH